MLDIVMRTYPLNHHQLHVARNIATPNPEKKGKAPSSIRQLSPFPTQIIAEKTLDKHLPSSCVFEES